MPTIFFSKTTVFWKIVSQESKSQKKGHFLQYESAVGCGLLRASTLVWILVQSSDLRTYPITLNSGLSSDFSFTPHRARFPLQFMFRVGPAKKIFSELKTKWSSVVEETKLPVVTMLCRATNVEKLTGACTFIRRFLAQRDTNAKSQEN